MTLFARSSFIAVVVVFLPLAACVSSEPDDAERAGRDDSALDDGAPDDGPCLACPPPASCGPQDVKAEGACDLFWGWKWDGEACVGVSGCSCAGHCDALYEELDACEAAHETCDPTDPPPAPPAVDCALLFDEAAKLLEAARSCNALSAGAAASCQTMVPTITGCGAPVASKESEATTEYLAAYELYAQSCPMPDSPCIVEDGPGHCVPVPGADALGRCEIVPGPTDS